MNTWQNMKSDDAFKDRDRICDGDEDEGCNDAVAVWDSYFEQCFQEACVLYPPCEKRKIRLINDKEETESQLKQEIIDLTKERDHLQEDVMGVKKAFNDLHRRFEKLKIKGEEFKKVIGLFS